MHGVDSRDTPGAAPTEPEPPTRRSVLVAYATPSLAGALLFTAIGMYLLKYSTDVLLISPAVIGLVFGLSRMWDAVTDPLVGYLSDRTRSRFGRRRPWMVVSALPVGASYYAIWAPPASLEGTALVVWLAVAIGLFYTFMTTCNVPYTALGAEISRGYHDRTRVFGARAFGDYSGVVLAAATILILERAGDPRAAAAWLAAGAGALMAVSLLSASAMLTERPDYQARAARTNPYRAFGDVLKNPYARLLLVVYFVETLGFQAVVSLLPYISEYILGTPGATGLYLFAAIGSTLVCLPAWLPLSRRFGKVRVWTATMFAKALLFFLLMFVREGDSTLIYFVTVCFGALSGAGAVLGPSLQADVIDTDEARTGERKEGTFFAAWGLAMKAAIGTSILLSGVVLDVSGFEPNVAQDESALLGLRVLTSVIPVVLHLIVGFLLMRFRLDARRYAEIATRTLPLAAVLGLLVFVTSGCGPEAPSGFGRVTALEPRRSDARLARDADGEFVVHAGEARRAWRTRGGERLLVPVAVGRGSRLEVAAANAGPAPAQARIRLVGEDAAPQLLFDERLEGEAWRSVAIPLAAQAGRSIELSLEIADGDGASAAIDWGEPILLEQTDAAPRPNIVLITLDTTRADAAADPQIAPNLAALARRGVAFTNAWSAATSTTPGHASILTGLPVDQHGAVSNRSELADELETLAEALTGRGLQTAASVTVDHIGLLAGFGQGFGRFRPAKTGDARDGARSVESVLDWLDGWAGATPRPFFLWVHLFDPHTPYGPPASFVDGEWAARGFALPQRRADPPTLPIFPGALPTPLAWLEGITNRDHVDALYRAGVAYADHLLGRVVDRIDALGLGDRTIFVVTADHGEALGEQGVYYQHAGLWPASLRVPLVVAGPGWPSGVTSDAPVSAIDVAPSLLAALDGRADESPLRGVLDRPEPDRRLWFAETSLSQLGFRDADVHFARALGPGQFGVLLDRRADGPHVRAIQRYARGATWLFDVNADPALERNLSGDAGSGVERYRELVRERRQEARAPSQRRALTDRAEAELRALGYAE